MNELAYAAKFIVSALAANTTLNTAVGGRIYEHPGPPSSSWPIITFSVLSAPDTTGNGATRVLTRPLYLIRAIEHGGAVPYSLADLIDSVLQGANGEVEDDANNVVAYVAGIIRESAYQMDEESQGEVYRHLGGRYRVNIHAF